MNEARGHAVVLGAGMGGLLAARVLSDVYREVTIVEPDVLPLTVAPRKGVPQGRHVHGLLARGEQILEELFPGFGAEIRDAGAVDVDVLAEVRFELAGRTPKRTSTGARSLQATRPLIEHHTRRRVLGLTNVTLVHGKATAPVATADGSRVTGVVIQAKDGAERTVTADLVVASMGRASVVPAWLERLGYERPVEEGTEIDIMYASSFVRLAPGALGADKTITIGVRDLPPRALAMFAVEDDRYLLTLIGHGGGRPPTERDAYLDWAESFAPADVIAAIRGGEMLGEIVRYRYKANLRRRYERLPRLPHGLVAFGDSVCSFSPVYGQGMTVSAMQPVVLRHCLTNGDDRLPERFYTQTASAINDAWTLTQIADGAMPHATPPRSPLIRAAILGIDPLLNAAQRDSVVATQLYRLLGLIDAPTAMLTPSIVARIAAANARLAADRITAVIPLPARLRTA